MTRMRPDGIVTIATDFGVQDAYAGAVKGILLRINPRLRIVDITHQIPSFDILEGAFNLNFYYRFFPRGTIHLLVVDPGVGGKRKGILIKSDDFFFVGPDNGVFSFVYDRENIREIRNLTNPAYFLQRVSPTFHARDIFAPVCAYLSLGVEPKEFGTSAEVCYKFKFPEPVCGKDRLRGEIIHIDRFGNLISNISSDLLKDEKIRIKVGRRTIKGLGGFYAEAKKRELIALIGSSNYLEISVSQGSARKLLKARAGGKITVEKIKK